MRLLDRYIARQFMATFLALSMGLPWLFVVADITDNLDKYLARGLSRGAVAMSYVYFLPQFVFWALPIAGLVATVFTIGNMTRHQEIAAAKAGGVSFYRLMAPILLLASLLSIGAVALGELLPITTLKRLEVLGEKKFSTATFRTNFVFQAADGSMLAIRRLDSERDEMQGIVVERDATEERPGAHLTARDAMWNPDRGWTMRNGYQRVLYGGEVEQAFQFDSVRIAGLAETPEELMADPKEPEEMGYMEMSRFIDSIERSGGDIRKMRVERAQKIALPLALFVIVLFGAPLSTSSSRGGAAYGVGISLGVTLVYLLLFKVGTAIGSSGAIHPLVAAWAPNALFFVAGIYLLVRVRT
ncbi:MAG: LptF/LptG family permease [Gemmatimonadetes bacterium]|nr:LptF/LptG family permease [Gemmatimonadota bacterium]